MTEHKCERFNNSEYCQFDSPNEWDNLSTEKHYLWFACDDWSGTQEIIHYCPFCGTKLNGTNKSTDS